MVFHVTCSIFRLPWWCVYITWSCVMLCSMTSSFFIMLYGMKYGYNKSGQWMISNLIAFLQTFFILEPLKLLITAILVVFVLKKPGLPFFNMELDLRVKGIKVFYTYSYKIFLKYLVFKYIAFKAAKT